MQHLSSELDHILDRLQRIRKLVGLPVLGRVLFVVALVALEGCVTASFLWTWSMLSEAQHWFGRLSSLVPPGAISGSQG
eukprot:1474399-Amphidinium_carterae.1